MYGVIIMDKFKLYDSINTTAVRWLTYQHKTNNKSLGILNFDNKNISHLWFLHMLESYRVFNDYDNYYIDCGFFKYLYIRYIKKFKGARRKKNVDVLMINVDVFIQELIESFEENLKIEPSIVEKIYKEYWGK